MKIFLILRILSGMSTVPEQIERLVERFDRNIDTCKSQAYNEAQLRVDFINPFWNALGWDVENKAGRAFAYRNVVYEDAIKVGTATKAPDYCFRIGGMRKFFLETKAELCYSAFGTRHSIRKATIHG